MSRPDIGDEEIENVLAVLRSGTLSMGPFVSRFEHDFARYLGTAEAVAVSSGTAGLHMCIRAAGIGEGDEVVTTPFSFVSSANCILFERARAVFVDIEETSMTIDPVLAAAALTERTRGMLPVHVFGQACAMDEIAALCANRGVFLIEDACEAIGSEHRGRQVGTFGDAAVFSFYPNKQMTTGEGAMIATDDRELATLLRSLRNQGRFEGGAWLMHERLGYNYRMSELSAALGVAQLARLDDLLVQRDFVAGIYAERLAGIAGIELMARAPWTSKLSWFAAIARLDAAIDRDALMRRLAAAGVPTRAYFAPLHLQPHFRELYGHGPGDFPVTERVARSTLALPFHTRMGEDEVARVCEVLERAL